MKKLLFIFLFSLIIHQPAFAVDTAPRISDREIIERLSKLEEGQKSLNLRIDSLSTSLNKRIDDLRSDMNKRFDIITWMLGLFITIAAIILGFNFRLLMLMQRRQTQMETSLETQKDEMAFLKNLIEKLLPPKGVL